MALESPATSTANASFSPMTSNPSPKAKQASAPGAPPPNSTASQFFVAITPNPSMMGKTGAPARKPSPPSQSPSSTSTSSFILTSAGHVRLCRTYEKRNAERLSILWPHPPRIPLGNGRRLRRRRPRRTPPARQLRLRRTNIQPPRPQTIPFPPQSQIRHLPLHVRRPIPDEQRPHHPGPSSPRRLDGLWPRHGKSKSPRLRGHARSPRRPHQRRRQLVQRLHARRLSRHRLPLRRPANFKSLPRRRHDPAN